MHDDPIDSGAEYSPNELQQIGELRKKLDSIPPLHARREQLYKIEPKPNSQLAVDNEATNPTELGHLVTYCQNMAIDNLRSLRLLLNPSEAAGVFLPQVAMYPMIRAVIESSAQALWLLQPDDSQERIMRTLRARQTEVAFEFDLAQMMHGDDDGDLPAVKKQKAQARQRAGKTRRLWLADIRAISARQDIAQNEIDQGLPGYGPIVEEAATSTIIPARFARSVWQMVSGLTHPSSTRGLGFSRVQELDGSTSELRITRMTAEPRTVNAGLLVGLAFYGAAEDLLGTRLITPSGR